MRLWLRLYPIQNSPTQRFPPFSHQNQDILIQYNNTQPNSDSTPIIRQKHAYLSSLLAFTIFNFRKYQLLQLVQRLFGCGGAHQLQRLQHSLAERVAAEFATKAGVAWFALAFVGSGASSAVETAVDVHAGNAVAVATFEAFEALADAAHFVAFSAVAATAGARFGAMGEVEWVLREGNALPGGPRRRWSVAYGGDDSLAGWY